MKQNNSIDLECRDLIKTFGSFTAVDKINFSVPQGSFFSILGPSGCGKTTLLRMLAGFEQANSGDIIIKQKSMTGIPPNKRPVNMVFQHLALFPTMNVAENIAYGLKRRGESKSSISDKIKKVLARVDLSGSESKEISQLSGGQKQRIAIARCLVLEPDVLLLDEPLGALDLKLREQMKVELKHLQQEFGTTFVYITHDQSEALVMSDQVAVMNQGKFEQVGTPQELYYHPKTAFVAKFVGETNHFRGKVLDQQGDQLSLSCGGLNFSCLTGHSMAQGQEADLFIRPEAITLHRPGEIITGDNQFEIEVEELLFDGARSQVSAKVLSSGQQLSVLLPQTNTLGQLNPGDKMIVRWDASQVSCLPAGVGA